MQTQKFMGRHQLVDRLAAQVGSRKEAESILKKRGHMSSDGKLTAAGRARDRMTASERAVDRASRASGKPKNVFVYNPSSNTAKRKRP
jgi:hypothetical protein